MLLSSFLLFVIIVAQNLSALPVSCLAYFAHYDHTVFVLLHVDLICFSVHIGCVHGGHCFLGYVGLLTGAKQGGFSISVDTRFDNSFWHGLIQWLKGQHTGQFLTFITRSTMENNATYAEALQSLNNTELIGPGFIILGGAGSGEGAIITRSATESVRLKTLADSIQNGTHYILQTNYG